MTEIIDSLEEVEAPYKNATVASKGKRFVNYLIDTAMYYGLTFVVAIVLVISFELLGLTYFSTIDESDPSYRIINTVIAAATILLYYTVFEYYSKGRSLGKLITRTRAVTVSRDHLTFKHAFLRSLCRLIPFDALTFLGESSNGMHDKLSKTVVVVNPKPRSVVE